MTPQRAQALEAELRRLQCLANNRRDRQKVREEMAFEDGVSFGLMTAADLVRDAAKGE